jgi:hypothetical protein
VCAAGWLGLASGEPASHRIADEGYKCAHKSAGHSCEGECSARTHGVDVCTRTGASTKGVYMTNLPCAPRCRRAAVRSCRPPPRPSAEAAPAHLRWGTRCTHSGVLHRLTYWEYSHVLPKGTVSTRTCGMRRCARVVQPLDRRRRWCRCTCGGVLDVLTVGYSESSQGYCEYSPVLPKGTVSTRTCGMRRCADVISNLDRWRLRLRRRTCGGVLGVLTFGYSEYSQGKGCTHRWCSRVSPVRSHAAEPGKQIENAKE